MLSANSYLHEVVKPVTGLAPILPSSSTPDYVSLKNVLRMTVIILCNNATTVTGSAITLKQATSVAGTGEKALEFEKMFANADTDAGDALTETSVVSDTFTTGAVNDKNTMYVVDITPDMLDLANDFDCVRVGTGDAVASVLSVQYLCHMKTGAASTKSVIID